MAKQNPSGIEGIVLNSKWVKKWVMMSFISAIANQRPGQTCDRDELAPV